MIRGLNMMQEPKSFLIRDLLGDVLAERVQGRLNKFFNKYYSLVTSIQSFKVRLLRLKF